MKPCIAFSVTLSQGQLSLRLIYSETYDRLDTLFVLLPQPSVAKYIKSFPRAEYWGAEWTTKDPT